MGERVRGSKNQGREPVRRAKGNHRSWLGRATALKEKKPSKEMRDWGVHRRVLRGHRNTDLVAVVVVGLQTSHEFF